MNNQTCLFYAAREGQLEMCKFLINRGCKFDILDKNKKNALHFAKTFKHHALVEYFNSLKETFKAKPQKESKQESRDAPPKKEKEKKVVRN
jgi:ankyrin repeat protein